MVDPLVLGMVILFSVALSPLLIYGVASGVPGQLLRPSQSAAVTAAVDLNSTTAIKPIEIKGNNPEEVLANAYNQSAYTEIEQCTSDSADASLCQTTMTMLIHSCKDNATWVSAC